MDSLWSQVPRTLQPGYAGYSKIDTVELSSIQEHDPSSHQAAVQAASPAGLLARLDPKRRLSAKSRRRLLQVGAVAISMAAGLAVLLVAGFFHSPSHSTASAFDSSGQATQRSHTGAWSYLHSSSHHSDSTTSLHALDADDAAASLSFAPSNEYGGPASDLYPWTVVEPHRTTTLTASTDLDNATDAKYAWQVSLLGEVQPLPDQSGAGPAELLFEFTQVKAEYAITLTETAADGSTRSVSDTVRCKYVRREIRELTDTDRERYFAAMEVVSRVDYDEGVAKYGSKFTNIQQLAKKHLYGNVCTPYHGGNSFFTAHAAFTLELDYAMQAVDPAVCQPFWDYTMDDLLYGHHWENSELWQDDWFGPLATTNEDHVLEGRFAGVTYIGKDYNFSEHNPYGILTKSQNVDPSMLVSRAHQFCDMKTDLLLPGCVTQLDCLNTTDLQSLHHCAEDRMHGNIHSVIGGFHGCPVSLGKFAATDEDYRHIVMQMGEVAEHLWSQNTGVTWKDYCDSDATFEACRGRCENVTEADLDGLSVPELRAKLEEYHLVYFGDLHDLSTFSSPLYNSLFHFTGNASAGFQWSFKLRNGEVATDEQQGALSRLMLNFACNPGKFGTMSTGSAPNDPIFWPIHPTFDRMWAYIRLSPKYASFDHTWGNESSCFGHGYEDVLPFSNLFGENSTEQYSNKQMYALFDPTNVDLPYVYADFEFEAKCASGLGQARRNSTARG